MKRWIRPVLLTISGILFVFAINLSIKTLPISGFNIPFVGWEGPYYWVTEMTPNDHSMGVPFTMFRYDKYDGTYYTSTLAIWLNAASGAVLGLGINKAIDNKKARRKTPS